MNKVIPYSLVAETDKFRQKLENLQSQSVLVIKNHELGADREQWFIDWQQELLVVFVEHLSESAWIEAIGPLSEQKLQIFYNCLICD